MLKLLAARSKIVFIFLPFSLGREAEDFPWIVFAQRLCNRTPDLHCFDLDQRKLCLFLCHFHWGVGGFPKDQWRSLMQILMLVNQIRIILFFLYKYGF